jgi:hypothetical protein
MPVRISKRSSARKASSSRKTYSGRRWSQHVTETSNALDLDPGVFTWSDPKRIAASLKHSTEASSRRKGSPLQSAMSMLNFYMNRAGGNMPAKQKRILNQAKEEWRKLFGRQEDSIWVVSHTRGGDLNQLPHPQAFVTRFHQFQPLVC